MDDRTKTLLEQYKMFIDVYKQHFDLYAKGFAVYFAGMGALSGFIYRHQDTVSTAKLYVAYLIPALSLVGFFGCYKCSKWVRHLMSATGKIEKELGVESFPFSGPLGIIWATAFGVAVFMLFGIIDIWLLRGHKLG